ncbi:MAG: LuxR C-terminal-related transcriptional regulator [Actinomycetota bacterium]|nr:LuxR C-terminal-related transcriptional regulator [Actinomycetota bacterium]
MLDIARGTEAFRARDWARTRDFLRGALSTTAPDEAFEMLAISSFWLDDGPTARLARERHFRALRQSGDDVGAARIAIALAWDATIFASDTAVARGWSARAKRLLGEQSPGEEHAWLALRQATLDGAGSATYAEARRLAQGVGAFDAEMTAAVLEGDARVAEGEVDRGLACMDEALAAACGDELEHPIAITFACCQLFAVCGRVRDYDHAFQWSQRVADLCERRNIWSVLSATRCSYSAILIARGRFAEAERLLVAAESRYGEKGLPRHRARATAWLADLRFRQGRLEDAKRLVDRATPEPARHVTGAAISLARGRAEEAIEHAAAYLRQADPEQIVLRAATLEILVRAEILGGREARADGFLQELLALAAQVERAPVVGASLVARGAFDEQRGELESARVAFADAIEIFEQAEAPYEAAMARIELARILEAAGRTEDARACRALGEERLRELRTDDAAPTVLTRRELAVLQLVAEGLSNPDIGRRLVISTHTVHRHVSNIMRKLAAGSRAAAVARAAQLGLF